MTDVQNADESLEIEVKDDADNPEVVVDTDTGAAVAAEKLENDIDEGIRKLQEKLEASEKRRLAAEKAANEAAQTAVKHKNEAQDANLHLISNAITTIEQSNDILKANLRAATASGDYDTMADIQVELSANAAKLAQLEQGKTALEAAPKAEAPVPFVADPVEALASQLSPRSASWVRSHPEFATDQRKYQAMIAAHNLAVANGEEPDSDGYFNSIESLLKIRQPDVDHADATSAAAAPVQRRSSPPAAPVSRTTATSGGGANRVTLSAEEREIAKLMGQTDAEYAKNKLALQREGRLN